GIRVAAERRTAAAEEASATPGDVAVLRVGFGDDRGFGSPHVHKRERRRGLLRARAHAADHAAERAAARAAELRAEAAAAGIVSRRDDIRERHRIGRADWTASDVRAALQLAAARERLFALHGLEAGAALTQCEAARLLADDPEEAGRWL